MPIAAGRARRSGFIALAVLLFCTAGAASYREVLAGPMDSVVPLYPRYADDQWHGPGMHLVRVRDLHFVAWLTARNADTLLTSPSSLFDTELCHPARDMLARGEPILALSLLGVPFRLVGTDPVRTYNFALIAMLLISAAGMCWLVSEWTGVREAGLVAGLFFAFHPVRLVEIVHPYIDDTVWIVLAMVFARRYLAAGRSRDSALFAAVVAMQLASSSYAIIASFFVALPIAIWLLVRYGVRKVSPVGLGVAVAILLPLGAAIFLPYSRLSGEGALADRVAVLMLLPESLLPGGRRFPGFALLALALVGLALPRARATRGEVGDPRLALAAGGLLALCVPMTVDGVANRSTPFYEMLAGIVPGMSIIRAPERLATGFQLALCALAGFGAAGVLRALPVEWRRWAGIALVAIAWALVVRPVPLLLGEPVVFLPHRQRPAEEWIDFFGALEAKGNSGPIVEIPWDPSRFRLDRIGSVSFHGRRTSTCASSHRPPESEEVRALAARPLDRSALARMREMGFSTIVVHHLAEGPWPYGPHFLSRMAELSRGRDRLLRYVHHNAEHTAYEILAPTQVSHSKRRVESTE